MPFTVQTKAVGHLHTSPPPLCAGRKVAVLRKKIIAERGTTRLQGEKKWHTALQLLIMNLQLTETSPQMLATRPSLCLALVL